jgi:hypothetical protein
MSVADYAFVEMSATSSVTVAKSLFVADEANVLMGTTPYPTSTVAVQSSARSGRTHPQRRSFVRMTDHYSLATRASSWRLKVSAAAGRRQLRGF